MNECFDDSQEGERMSIWQAIGFMALGGIVVEVFEIHAWRRYQQGKREGGFTPPSNNRR